MNIFNICRYKLHDDGCFRLQTIRYESIELTEQILTHKIDDNDTGHEQGQGHPKVMGQGHSDSQPGHPKVVVVVTPQKRRSESPNKFERTPQKPEDASLYNLEMLGDVALQGHMPKVSNNKQKRKSMLVPRKDIVNNVAVKRKREQESSSSEDESEDWDSEDEEEEGEGDYSETESDTLENPGNSAFDIKDNDAFEEVECEATIEPNCGSIVESKYAPATELPTVMVTFESNVINTTRTPRKMAHLQNLVDMDGFHYLAPGGSTGNVCDGATTQSERLIGQITPLKMSNPLPIADEDHILISRPSPVKRLVDEAEVTVIQEFSVSNIRHNISPAKRILEYY